MRIEREENTCSHLQTHQSDVWFSSKVSPIFCGFLGGDRPIIFTIYSSFLPPGADGQKA
jgi:hypothetical protein